MLLAFLQGCRSLLELGEGNPDFVDLAIVERGLHVGDISFIKAVATKIQTFN